MTTITDPHQTVPRPAAGRNAGTHPDQQWRIAKIQVINWGGFEGLNTLEFHPLGTLVTGASGCGKSTLLDAYLALIMPYNVPLNGASNQAEGRARSEGQRNTLSYMRGKIDADADPVTGEEIAQVLRGKNRSTWSIISAEFRSDRGNRYTLFRTYFAAASVRSPNEVQMRMFAGPGEIDVQDLAALAATGFKPATVEQTLPGTRHHLRYSGFSQTVYAALGIGANGDGGKALLMLAQIQAGGSISTVNDLYRNRVLERPDTYTKAENAVGHFNNLQSMYLKMRTAKEKSDRLAPIVETYDTAVASQRELEAIDSVGITRDGDTPYLEWRLATESRLIDAALDKNRDERTATDTEHSAARATEDGLSEELLQTQEVRRALGGDRLDELDASILRLEADRRAAEEERDRLLGKIGPLVEQAQAAGEQSPLASVAALAAAAAAAQTHVAGAPSRETMLRAARDAIQERRYPLLDELNRLKRDIATMSGRESRIDTRLDERRNQLAHAAGLQPIDLPFVAELIDVADGQERWRTAVDSVLGAFARTLVVDQDFLAEFSHRIDGVKLSAQLRFEGVALRDHEDLVGDPDRISARVVYKPTAFSHWIAAEIGKRDAICVEHADGLNGPGYRVALSGQTRNGTSGTVGQSGRHSIIGFANEQLIADLSLEVDALETQLMAIDTELKAHDEGHAKFTALLRASEHLIDAAWDRIDIEGIEGRIKQRHDDRSRLLASDVGLHEVDQKILDLDGRLRRARRLTFDAEGKVEAVQKVFGELVDRQDDLNRERERIEDSGRSTLTEDHTRRLDQALTALAAGAPFDHQSFRQTWVRAVSNHLSERLQAAQQRLGDMHQQLRTIFQSYLAQWPDPNLSDTADAYPDYKRILDDILATGLHARRVAWLEAVREWTAQDLLPLNGAVENSLNDIEKRLDDINTILAMLPFGAGRDRLRISSRRLAPDVVVSFRKELRRLANVPSRELSEDQLVQRFTELQEFIGLIRRSDDRHLTREMIERNPGRDALLDVRRHIEIEAVRHSQTGARLATYRRLSEKSGGETQELIAFILGSALRYRLGDEERARPRFAPVFLDEGFIKADAEFAGRAVQAWHGLGFQLVIAAPFDKVSGLGEYMGTLATVGKSQKTGFSQIMKVEPLAAFERDPWLEATGTLLDPADES
ncbi:SbcC/MukB-like Walker B domain-containing protein [Kribbella sp. NPDC006257]|uniref:ATP-binding protein n=1 Tax=Kribbella sp. NPDC006257 TaxID=3156738 RepID=UPI0033BABC4E